MTGIGISTEHFRVLPDLCESPPRTSADVNDAVEQQTGEICASMADLHARDDGDDRPDCPILNDLAAKGATPAAGT